MGTFEDISGFIYGIDALTLSAAVAVIILLIIIPTILFYVISLKIIFRAKDKSNDIIPTVVLRKFEVNENPAGNTFVEIIGRKAGLISFILTSMGRDTESKLLVTDKEILFQGKTIFSKFYQLIPLQKITSTQTGNNIPLKSLIFSIIFILLGIIISIWGFIANNAIILITSFIFILVGSIFLVNYGISKSMTLTIITSSGQIVGFNFKRSIIENFPLDPQTAKESILLLNKMVIDSLKGSGSSQIPRGIIDPKVLEEFNMEGISSLEEER